MFILNPPAPFLHVPLPTPQMVSQQSNRFPPFLTVAVPTQPYSVRRDFTFTTHAIPNRRFKMPNFQDIGEEIYDDDDDDEGQEEKEDKSEFSGRRVFRGREDEKDYDRDPEFAEILGSSLDDPEKSRSKMEERLRKKRDKILHTKTGSANPMKVMFKKFDFSNSYIWLEFYHAPLEKDVTLICDTIRSWHIVGRLGGCNSMNMQVSAQKKFTVRGILKAERIQFVASYDQTIPFFQKLGNIYVDQKLGNAYVASYNQSFPFFTSLYSKSFLFLQLSQFILEKRPTYDAVQGANVTPTTFYNIGDLEIQDNLARIWVDIGTSEPLLLDVLINALTQISSDYVGIKQVVFGGAELENWIENFTQEDAGCSVHKI